MNTPEQQAILYQKAKETVEMCAPHRIDPLIKHQDKVYLLNSVSLNCNYEDYEFPCAIVECVQVWADDVVYNRYGEKMKAKGMSSSCEPYTLTPPNPLFELEGKSVYIGDEIYDGNGCKLIVERSDDKGVFGHYCNLQKAYWHMKYCSLSPKPKTVMVELLVEDARFFADELSLTLDKIKAINVRRIEACKKALEQLK